MAVTSYQSRLFHKVLVFITSAFHQNALTGVLRFPGFDQMHQGLPDATDRLMQLRSASHLELLKVKAEQLPAMPFRAGVPSEVLLVPEGIHMPLKGFHILILFE